SGLTPKHRILKKACLFQKGGSYDRSGVRAGERFGSLITDHRDWLGLRPGWSGPCIGFRSGATKPVLLGADGRFPFSFVADDVPARAVPAEFAPWEGRVRRAGSIRHSDGRKSRSTAPEAAQYFRSLKPEEAGSLGWRSLPRPCDLALSLCGSTASS